MAKFMQEPTTLQIILERTQRDEIVEQAEALGISTSAFGRILLSEGMKVVTVEKKVVKR